VEKLDLSQDIEVFEAALLKDGKKSLEANIGIQKNGPRVKLPF
jgi:hypothetical protein